MPKKCHLILLAIVLCGCKTTTVEWPVGDSGKVIRVTDRRLLFNTDVQFGFESVSNEVRRVTVRSRSGPAEDTIRAAMEGFGEGAVRGLAKGQ